MQSPNYFLVCSLYDAIEDRHVTAAPPSTLLGTKSSCINRCKDVDNTGQCVEKLSPVLLTRIPDGGFFVFGDLSVKIEGDFRLYFSLYEIRG